MAKITVVPFGGLGNRMRVFNSALYLNEKFGNEYTELVWLIKPELNSEFHDLFESVEFEFKLVKGLKYFLFLKLVKHIFINKYESVYKFLFSFFGYDLILFDSDIKDPIKSSKLLNLQSYKKVLIATCHEFYPFGSFDNFIISKSVLDILYDLKLPKNLVGVHIRRTDHLTIISESGVEGYENAMKNELIQNPSCKFYLATDDYDVKNYLKTKFNEKILGQNIILSRNSPIGIQGALVDILALSRSKSIICNLKSSFVQTALKIGVTKKVVEV